jgi:hypothetical protein
MTPTTRIKRAAARRAAARVEFETAIREARATGLSWRQLADVSGLSVEGVRKIVARQS